MRTIRTREIVNKFHFRFTQSNYVCLSDSEHYFFLGCNELCESSKHGCSHNCTNSPLGPFCFCRAGQFLADDNKSCRLPLSSADPGTWKVVLIVCGVIGLVLLAVIIVVTFKYRQTKVGDCLIAEWNTLYVVVDICMY